MQRLAVVATLLAALALTGAVEAWERALLAWGWCAALLLLPRARLDRSDATWVRLVAGLLLAALPGLLLLPTGMVEALAPGMGVFLAGSSWTTLSVAPDATVAAIVDLGMLGVAGLAIAGALRGVTEDALAERVSAAAGIVVVLVALHEAFGWTSWFGVLPVREVDRVFLPPLINPNHTGALLVAAAPFVVAARQGATGWRRHLRTAILFGIVAFPLIARSMGVAVALASLAVLSLVRQQRPERRARVVMVAMVGVTTLAWAVQALTPRWWALSVAPRLDQWADSLTLWWSFPWFGVGLGAYADAYPPWRTVPGFLTFAHAHSDGIEWLVETGVWGLVCGVWTLSHLRARVQVSSWPAASGLFALGVAAAVDFPLHIPAVSVLAVALFRRATALADAEPVGGISRTWRYAAFALAWLSTVEALRTWSVTAAVAQPEGVAARRLLEISPWGEDSAAVWLARAETREGPLRTEALREAHALAPASARIARGVASLAARENPRPPEADAWLERALRLDPQDLRLWWLVAVSHARGGRPIEAAAAAADAFRRWPHEVPTSPAVWEEAWSWLPVGVWWLDALAEAPAHWSARLGWWSLREGDAETALLAMEQAASLRPDIFRYNNTHIDALLALERFEQASSEARAWTDAEPDRPWAWVALASVALSRGDDPFGGAVTIAAWRNAGQPVAKRLLFGCLKACEVGRCACDLATARALLEAERARDKHDVARCASARDGVLDANPWLRGHGPGIACGAGD